MSTPGSNTGGGHLKAQSRKSNSRKSLSRVLRLDNSMVQEKSAIISEGELSHFKSLETIPRATLGHAGSQIESSINTLCNETGQLLRVPAGPTSPLNQRVVNINRTLLN
jgi:hypothetical protein